MHLSRRALATAGISAALSATGVICILGWLDLRRTAAEVSTARSLVRDVAQRRDELETAEGRFLAMAQLRNAGASLRRAHQRLSHSPAISAAGLLPGLSAQRRGMLELVGDAEAATRIGGSFVGAFGSLAADASLHDGQMDLDALSRLEAQVHAAASSLAGLHRSDSQLWGTLRTARRSFNRQCASLSDHLATMDSVVSTAHSFLGADGERTYLIAIENNAEMRDQGIITSYAVVRFDHGRGTLDSTGHISDLRTDGQLPRTPLPAGTKAVFGSFGVDQLWQSVNAEADFSRTAQTITSMYQRSTGRAVDGIVGADVPALGSILKVIGPVAVPGLPQRISADNAAPLLLHDIYQGLAPAADQQPRREHLDALTRQVMDRLLHGRYGVVALSQQLATATSGNHVLLWSRFASEERTFELTGVAGTPAFASPDRTFHVAVENRTVTKLDYYIHPHLSFDIKLTPRGTALVRTTITVANDAPRGAAPSYQLGPDHPDGRPGEYIAWVLLWGPSGATQADSVIESGLQLSQNFLTVEPGQHLATTFDTIIPDAVRDGSVTFRLVPQPRWQAVDVHARLEATGWRVTGSDSWDGRLDRTQLVAWRVEPAS